MKKKVFVSFDYENDRHYKNLLEAWEANPNFELSFSDVSSGEIKTEDISRVKAGLTTKINQADITLIIIGKEANKQHKDYEEIGYKNWLNFEIARSKKNENKLIGVKLDKTNASPEELLNSGATFITYSKDAIVEALK